MTVKASDAVATAKKEIGTRATNYRKCKYNTWYYGSAVSGDAYHWCAVFICWVFHQLGALVSLLYLKTASCGYMAKAFLDKGRLIRPKSLTAGLSTKDVKVGDIVFFHWSTERSTLVPGTYVSDHVGIVTAVNSNGTIDTVEVYYATPVTIHKEYGGYLRAKYRVSPLNGSYYPYQYDAERTNDQDGYAGAIGKTIDRLQITLSL